MKKIMSAVAVAGCVSVPLLATTPAQAAAPQTVSVAAATSSCGLATVGYGHVTRGADVRLLQNDLQRYFHFNAYAQTIKVDGVFGSKTREAVIRVQNDYNSHGNGTASDRIAVDGIAGPQTWFVLGEPC